MKVYPTQQHSIINTLSSKHSWFAQWIVIKAVCIKFKIFSKPTDKWTSCTKN